MGIPMAPQGWSKTVVKFSPNVTIMPTVDLDQLPPENDGNLVPDGHGNYTSTTPQIPGPTTSQTQENVYASDDDRKMPAIDSGEADDEDIPPLDNSSTHLQSEEQDAFDWDDYIDDPSFPDSLDADTHTVDNSTNQDFYVPSGFDPDRYKFSPLPSPSNITDRGDSDFQVPRHVKRNQMKQRNRNLAAEHRSYAATASSPLRIPPNMRPVTYTGDPTSLRQRRTTPVDNQNNSEQVVTPPKSDSRKTKSRRASMMKQICSALSPQTKLSESSSESYGSPDSQQDQQHSQSHAETARLPTNYARPVSQGTRAQRTIRRDARAEARTARTAGQLAPDQNESVDEVPTQQGESTDF